MKFCCDPRAKSVLSVLKAPMSLFQKQWQESHVGGEISKFGNFPFAEWILDRMDDMGRGWMVESPRALLWPLDYAFENDSETVMTDGSCLEYEKDNLPPSLCDLEVFDNDGIGAKEDCEYVSILQHTSQILDHMWCAHNPKQINHGQKDDWRVLKLQMRDR